MEVLCGVIIFFSLVYAIVCGLSNLKYESNVIGKIVLLVFYFGLIIWIAKTFIF
jgi:hypothetical protein